MKLISGLSHLASLAARKVAGLLSLLRFQRKGKGFLPVILDRMFLETQTERYFVVLRTQDGCHSVFISLDNIPADAASGELFPKSGTLTKVLKKLQVKIKSVRLLHRANVPGAAICFMKQGLFIRRVPLDIMEAVRLSFEHGLPLEVPKSMLQPGRFDFDGFSTFTRKNDCLFSTKYMEREDIKHCSEVIM